MKLKIAILILLLIPFAANAQRHERISPTKPKPKLFIYNFGAYSGAWVHYWPDPNVSIEKYKNRAVGIDVDENGYVVQYVSSNNNRYNNVIFNVIKSDAEASKRVELVDKMEDADYVMSVFSAYTQEVFNYNNFPFEVQAFVTTGDEYLSVVNRFLVGQYQGFIHKWKPYIKLFTVYSNSYKQSILEDVQLALQKAIFIDLFREIFPLRANMTSVNKTNKDGTRAVEISINCGSSIGVCEGMRFSVRNKSNSEEIGRLVVTSVEPNLANCNVKGGGAQLLRGGDNYEIDEIVEPIK